MAEVVCPVVSSCARPCAQAVAHETTVGGGQTKRTLSVLIALAFLSGCFLFESGDLAKCKTAATEVDRGVLTPDARGVVTLPAGLTGATFDGRAYVTARPGGKRWVLFRTWGGKAANLRGYLYTAGDNAAIGSQLSVTTDMAGIIAPAQVTVESSLGNSWYYVSRSMD